jgi:vacuolar-type H+-ATPase subunit F/Vma7
LAKQGKIYTRKIIAEVLMLSEKRVKQLTDEGILKEFSEGHYKLLPAVQGYIGYLQNMLGGGSTDYNQEKAKLTQIKREDAELELKQKRNELHKSGDVEFIVTNMLIAFKAKLEVLPYKTLPAILNIPDTADKADYISSALKSAVDEALNELAEYNPEQFDEEKYLAGLDDSGVLE